MAHPLTLRAQVVDVLRVRTHRERHSLEDLEPEPFQTTVLCGVVRHEPHSRHAEVDEDVCPDAVLAAVDPKTELGIRVDGVTALVLEAVRADLVADADATTFVAPQVHHDAAILFR